MAKVVWTVDDEGKLFVNGEKADESDDWREVREVELKEAPTDIRVEALNRGEPGPDNPACVWLYVTENGKVVEKADGSWRWDGKSVYVEKSEKWITESPWSRIADTFLDKGAYPIWTSKTGLRRGSNAGQWITFEWSKPLLERPVVQTGLGVAGVAIATGLVGKWLDWW